ncbi:MAG: LPXTG cell wall anchor domain-containing protein [Lactobacillus crispatus]|nr:LPXTG cell wall anchor domain-containing protein [Lactobacillus crispatus]
MFQIKDKTYPDGTKSTATVPVTVIAPNVPDVIYVPKGDKVPDPSTVVTNSNDIKDKIPDTTYTWKTTPDTPNTKVVINYKANNPGTPDTPVTPPVKPEQKPTTPTSNTNDDTPAPTPHATKTPAKDNGGKKTRTKNSGLDNSEKGKTNNGYVTVRPLATAMPVSPAMKKTVASEQKSTLPQTGKKDNVALTAIGVAIAAAGSLLGLADSKKHRS